MSWKTKAEVLSRIEEIKELEVSAEERHNHLLALQIEIEVDTRDILDLK